MNGITLRSPFHLASLTQPDFIGYVRAVCGCISFLATASEYYVMPTAGGRWIVSGSSCECRCGHSLTHVVVHTCLNSIRFI